MAALAPVGPPAAVRVADTIALTRRADRPSGREREAVVLRDQDDLGIAETAAIMKLSEAAVKWYTADAMRKLRNVLVA